LFWCERLQWMSPTPVLILFTQSPHSHHPSHLYNADVDMFTVWDASAGRSLHLANLQNRQNSNCHPTTH
jgi:hypothetical protein